jgi:hypothetical protein
MQVVGITVSDACQQHCKAVDGKHAAESLTSSALVHLALQWELPSPELNVRIAE